MLWLGSIIGVICGLAHAIYIYRVVANQGTGGDTADHGRAGYFALWTLLLWVLAGSYVLVLWLAGIVLYLIFKAFR